MRRNIPFPGKSCLVTNSEAPDRISIITKLNHDHDCASKSSDFAAAIIKQFAGADTQNAFTSGGFRPKRDA